METVKKEKSLDPILKQMSKVLLPGDVITIKFKCPKFAYLELIVREIPTINDPSIEITNG